MAQAAVARVTVALATVARLLIIVLVHLAKIMVGIRDMVANLTLIDVASNANTIITITIVNAMRVHVIMSMKERIIALAKIKLTIIPYLQIRQIKPMALFRLSQIILAVEIQQLM